MKYFFVLLCFFLLGIAQAAEKIVLQNKFVRLELDRNNFALLQMRDLVRKVKFLKKNGGSLFALALWDPDHPTVETKPPAWYATRAAKYLKGDQAKSFRYSLFRKRNKQILTLNYYGIPEGKGTVDVKVTVILPDNSSLFKWRFSMNNRTSLKLYQLNFPIMRGLASNVPNSENTDYMAVPVYSGRKIKSPRTKRCANQGLNDYPSAGSSLQMLAYVDGQGGGLYLASYDPKGYRKTFIANPMASKQSFYWHLCHYGDSNRSGTWMLPYSIICGPFQGDWYDAAKIYRKQFASKVWTPLYKRKDIAPWFRDLSVWFQGNDWKKDSRMEKFTNRLVTLRNLLGENYGFHWYIWQKYIAHDYKYPDYFPARPGFKEAVKKAQANGIHVMPYTNMHLFGKDTTQWEAWKGAEMAIRDPDGSITKGGAIKNMVPMCLGDSRWRNYYVDIERQLVKDYHVDALYLDELYCFPNFCFAKNHGHPSFGGDYAAVGARDILKKIRALKVWGIKRAVTVGEQMGEVYMEGCDGLLNAHVDQPPTSIPMFQVVNSDNTTEIGNFINKAEIKSKDTFMSNVGFSFVRGRQLGWFNFDQFDLTKPQFSWQLNKLKEFCKTRRAGQPFLFFGEFLRTPDLSNVPRADYRVQTWLSGFKKKPVYQEPVVLAECYRSPQGEIGIILTNRTDKDHTINIPWNTKDWGLAVGTNITRSDYLNGNWTEGAVQPLPKELSITIPAYSPMIVKLTQAK